MHRNFRLPLALIALVCGLSGTVYAVLPPMSPEELEKAAALIVTGSVSSVEVAQDGTGDHINWTYRLQAKVDSVEKGDGAQPGEMITIHCWRWARRPDGWAGPSGHGSIPARDSRFRMWLTTRGEGGWEPLEPNGIELFDGSPAFVTPELKEGSLPEGNDLAVSWLGLFTLILAGAGLVVLMSVFLVLMRLKSSPASTTGRDG